MQTKRETPAVCKMAAIVGQGGAHFNRSSQEEQSQEGQILCEFWASLFYIARRRLNKELGRLTPCVLLASVSAALRTGWQCPTKLTGELNSIQQSHCCI